MTRRPTTRAATSRLRPSRTSRVPSSLQHFRPLARNPNRHTQQGLGLLEASMDRVGYVAPMTAARNGAVLDGNARLEKVATKFDGVTPLVIEHDGRRPIIMVRTDIPDEDDPRARDIIVGSNRIAEADLEWDTEVLKQFAAEGLDLKAFEFDAKTLTELTGAGSDEMISTPTGQWMIVLTCRDEAQQRELLDRFLAEGLRCRALVS